MLREGQSYQLKDAKCERSLLDINNKKICTTAKCSLEAQKIQLISARSSSAKLPLLAGGPFDPARRLHVGASTFEDKHFRHSYMKALQRTHKSQAMNDANGRQTMASISWPATWYEYI